MADWIKSAWLRGSRLLLGATGLTHNDANRRVIDEKQSEAFRAMNQRIVYDRLQAEPGMPYERLFNRLEGPDEERQDYVDWLLSEVRVRLEPGEGETRCYLVDSEWPESVKHR